LLHYEYYNELLKFQNEYERFYNDFDIEKLLTKRKSKDFGNARTTKNG